MTIADADDESRECDDITELLKGPLKGDPVALERLYVATYRELRKRAANLLRQEPAGHTLQPSALVNELFLRLFGHDGTWEDRSHFFAVASKAMRRILVDHARAKNRQKRGDGRKVPLEGLPLADDFRDPAALIDIDAALRLLEEKHARQAEVVDMHFFLGLSLEEIASILSVNVRTVKRDWSFAKAWLRAAVRTSYDTPGDTY